MLEPDLHRVVCVLEPQRSARSNDDSQGHEEVYRFHHASENGFRTVRMTSRHVFKSPTGSAERQQPRDASGHSCLC